MIIHIVNKLEVGGVEVGALSLLEYSFLNEIEYNILAVKGCDDEFYSSIRPELKSNIILGKGWLFSFLYILNNLKSIDLVVTSLWRSHVLGIFCKLLKFRVIHFVHNTRFAHVVDKLITKLSLKIADHIFVDSNESKQWLASYVSPVKLSSLVDVIPMNVSFLPANFIVLPKSRQHQKPLSFIYVGRFCVQKNIIRSMDFLYELYRKGINFTFDLYGRDDGELEVIQAYVNHLGLHKFVQFKGQLSPFCVEKIMCNYDFYLQTSTAEGMAISVFQSISSGLIPVVTPVGEIKNYSEHGVNAFHLTDIDGKLNCEEFIFSLNNKQFNNYSVGKIINSDDYPIFHQRFFERLSSIL